MASFEGFAGYKNRNQAAWLRGENHHCHGAATKKLLKPVAADADREELEVAPK